MSTHIFCPDFSSPFHAAAVVNCFAIGPQLSVHRFYVYKCHMGGKLAAADAFQVSGSEGNMKQKLDLVSCKDLLILLFIYILVEPCYLATYLPIFLLRSIFLDTRIFSTTTFIPYICILSAPYLDSKCVSVTKNEALNGRLHQGLLRFHCRMLVDRPPVFRVANSTLNEQKGQ
jgi:hypothetical protein